MGKIKIEDLEPITATAAKVGFGEVLYETSVNGKKFLISRQGKPISVIISYKEYCRLLEGKQSEPAEQA